MGDCIICGASVDGRVCDTHEEDVVFEFRGSRPDELTPGRYYRGSVDGFAEFGVFVDIGDSVTGLLHRSELDRRLDSLDWEPGDTVFVQVTNVRDNGNVDLGWSIRQAEREFRGVLVDDPERPHEVRLDELEGDSGNANPAGSTDDGAGRPTGAAETDDGGSADAGGGVTVSPTDVSPADDGGTAAAGGGATTVVEEPTRVPVDSLSDHEGELVRIEGEVETARQTSGPTVFELRDETGTVECAAFEEAGVRAYPEVGVGDVVRLEGEVEYRRGEIQVETTALVVLDDDERSAVTQRMADALEAEAEPESVEPLAPDPVVDAVTDEIREVATAIRRAVLQGRPVIVRHSATADGYVAGAALERATLPLVGAHQESDDAAYHYFDRRPLEGGVYDMEDATKDVTAMLDANERHGEKYPLFAFVAAGGTAESLDGFELLDVYGAPRVVVDAVPADEAVAGAVEAAVSVPTGVGETSAAALAANAAAAVNPEARDGLGHLPALGFHDPPEAYVELAAESGYDAETLREIREAIALVAHYQSYEDKRELVTDLLFDPPGEKRGLASHVSEQYRTKVDAAVETAEANVERREASGLDVAVLDTDAYAHRYEFPPTELLVDELFRRGEADLLLALGTDELYVRSRDDLDVRAVADRAAEAVPGAGLSALSPRAGRLGFLAGERDAVLEAVVDAAVAELA